MLSRLSTAAAAAVLALLSCFPAMAQTYGLKVVRVHDDIGVVTSATDTVDLTGYSTYRVYVTTAFAEDKVVSITGEGGQPGAVNTTTSFFQSAYGGTMPMAINPIILPLAPDAAYDSWVTIGVDGPVDSFNGEASPSILQAPSDPWTTVFEPGDGAAGSSFTLHGLFGGGWIVTPDATNATAGEDRQVLIGQFTTDGELSGLLKVQVLRQGLSLDEDDTADLRLYLPFSEAVDAPPPPVNGAGFCGDGTVWDAQSGQCVEACPLDIDGDGVGTILDLIEVLSFFGGFCY